MLLDGEWQTCPDGIIRPVIHGEVEASDGSWIKATFLVDSGADRTVLSADVLNALTLPPVVTTDQLAGVGGHAASVVVATRMPSGELHNN
jgi:hypothetical protein